MIRLVEYLASGLVDNTGAPLASGLVKCYDSTTGKLAPIFQDESLTLPYPNPVTLDAKGSLIAYTDRCLKLQVSSSSRTFLYSVDGIGSSAAAIQPGDFAANAIGTTQLQDLGVSDANISDNSVSGTVFGNSCVITASFAPNGVTRPCQDVSNAAFSSADSGNFQTASTSAFVAVNNASVTISCNGSRPVFLMCTKGYVQGLTSQSLYLQIWKNSTTEVGRHQVSKIICPSQAFKWIDTAPVAGNNTYQLRAMVSSNTTTTITSFLLYAQEI